MGGLWRGDLGGLWRGDSLLFSLFSWECPDLEQVRVHVKLTSEREYPLLNVYFIYMDKNKGGKYLDCTDPQETA